MTRIPDHHPSTAHPERTIRILRHPRDFFNGLLGAHDRQEIYSMLQTIKRKVNSEVRELIAETVEQPEDVRGELDELRAFLAPAE